MPMSRSRDGDKCVSSPRPADFHCVGFLLRGRIFGGRFQRERNAFSGAIDRWKTRGDGRWQAFCRALSFRLFCCSAAACVMRCHAWNERLVFGGEWRLSLSMGIFGLVFHAFLSCCPVFRFSMFLALQLCPLLLFLLMPEFVLVIGAQRVLDSRAENPDGRRFMRAFHVRGVGEKVRAKKNPPEGGLVGHRETDARGWGACAPRGRGGRGLLPPGWPIRPWRRRSDGPLRPS